MKTLETSRNWWQILEPNHSEIINDLKSLIKGRGGRYVKEGKFGTERDLPVDNVNLVKVHVEMI